MKAIEIMNALFALAPGDYARTCDTLKAGSPDTEVTRAAVCCFATPQVIRDAAAWGAQLLITHEPTYYDHWDNMADTPVGHAKRALLESTGMALYRYHDHPHAAQMDLICEGEIEALDLKGHCEGDSIYGNMHFTLDKPMTARELAAHVEQNLNIAHVRICGTTDMPCTKLVFCWGTPGGVFEELCGEGEIILTGEACEWKLGEYARDAQQLGMTKSLLILGHCGSEREGMAHIARMMQRMFPTLETRYFDSGEVYTYP